MSNPYRGTQLTGLDSLRNENYHLKQEVAALKENSEDDVDVTGMMAGLACSLLVVTLLLIACMAS